MISKNTKKLGLFIGVVFCSWLLYQIACMSYWYIMSWSMSPDNYSKVVDKFEAMPTNTLIKRLHSMDIFSPYPQVSIQVLAKRKDKEAVSALIKLLSSWNSYIRKDAIWALSLINDDRAIEPLMGIIRKGEKSPDYDEALSALSKMRYDGAFQYVVARSKEPDAYRNGSVSMLKDFCKPECIPLLVDIRNRIKDTDSMPKFGRSQIDDAIAYIKSLLKDK